VTFYTEVSYFHTQTLSIWFWSLSQSCALRSNVILVLLELLVHPDPVGGVITLCQACTYHPATQYSHPLASTWAYFCLHFPLITKPLALLVCIYFTQTCIFLCPCQSLQNPKTQGTLYYIVCQKNIPAIISRSLIKYCQILIIFGRNILEKIGLEMVT